eukprot:TRINITY_DN60097_c0_g1_i1.p1 TRINITY_DN60097_c0_g1~~TRINITY_DN60097_c0_g1_i1.p1  ORF type:complete len:255 (+),score=32.76 TRINITY_DN60097_c0_g1_i1:158-922(+)
MCIRDRYQRRVRGGLIWRAMSASPRTPRISEELTRARLNGTPEQPQPGSKLSASRARHRRAWISRPATNPDWESACFSYGRRRHFKVDRPHRGARAASTPASPASKVKPRDGSEAKTPEPEEPQFWSSGSAGLYLKDASRVRAPGSRYNKYAKVRSPPKSAILKQFEGHEEPEALERIRSAPDSGLPQWGAGWPHLRATGSVWYNVIQDEPESVTAYSLHRRKHAPTTCHQDIRLNSRKSLVCLLYTSPSPRDS